MPRGADNLDCQLTAGRDAGRTPASSLAANDGSMGSQLCSTGCQATEAHQADIFDMHCHLAFYDNPREVAQELGELGVGCLNATVTPVEFQRVTEALDAAVAGRLGPSCIGEDPRITRSPVASHTEDLPANGRAAFPEFETAGVPTVRTGVGLHPWWIADGSADEAFARWAADLARDERYVAEIGLDFSRGDNARDKQVRLLERILDACEGSEHVLSLHAVRSADVLLDLLEKHHICEQSHAILHWFSGTSDELARARRMGCLFSVNPRMLATRKGREYARQIPAPQLLLETDLPYEKDGPVARTATAHATLLRQTLADLCELRNEDVAGIIAANSRLLLQMP